MYTEMQHIEGYERYQQWNQGGVSNEGKTRLPERLPPSVKRRSEGKQQEIARGGHQDWPPLFEDDERLRAEREQEGQGTPIPKRANIALNRQCCDLHYPLPGVGRQASGASARSSSRVLPNRRDRRVSCTR